MMCLTLPQPIKHYRPLFDFYQVDFNFGTLLDADNIASIGIHLSYVLIQFLVVDYGFMEQHQVCIDTHCRCMYFGTDNRSTVFFKPALPTPRANDPSPITARASPLAERSEKNFCVELWSKVRRLLDAVPVTPLQVLGPGPDGEEVG
jgi:hypothetical protein